MRAGTVAGRRGPLVAGALVLLVGGCGALRNGPQQQVRITTVPPGARLALDGMRMTSPAEVTLDRDRDYTVTARLEGFRPARGRLRSRRDGTVKVGNCLLFLCLPQLWEAGSPSAYRLEPAELDLMLEPAGWSPR